MPPIRHLGLCRQCRDGAWWRFFLCALVLLAAAATFALVRFVLLPSGEGEKVGEWAPYQWPIKPFNRPHPIRGNFDDPRMPNHHINGPGPFNFHYGVDISAPGGTAVYAVAPGTASFPGVKEADLRGRPVAVVVRGKGVRFEYWHIKPVVESGQHVAKRQLLGSVIRKWGHLHLTEMRGGRPVNPLRIGGLTPYHDHTKPTIVSVMLYRNGSYLPATSAPLSGRVDLVLDAYDTPELKSNWPWARVTPALIRWRLLSEATGKVAISAQTTVDFRLSKPWVALTDVFAPGTRQNGRRRTGVYNFWLVREFDTHELSDGTYKLVVLASDTRSNTAERTFELTVAN